MPLSCTLRPLHRCALLAALLLPSSACHTVVSGTHAVELGYGPPAASIAGYDDDPVPRPRVTGWTPPPRTASPAFEGGGPSVFDAGPREPVPHTQDVRDVCAKRAELGDPQPEAACLRRTRIARLYRGLDRWKSLVACVGTAEQLDAVEACEREHPPAFALGGEHERELLTCLHVLALSMVEEVGSEPMMSVQELVEIEPIALDCVRTLVDGERESRGPKRYYELLDCIDGAETLAAAEACEVEDD